jgi:hypothetical protein
MHIISLLPLNFTGVLAPSLGINLCTYSTSIGSLRRLDRLACSALTRNVCQAVSLNRTLFHLCLSALTLHLPLPLRPIVQLYTNFVYKIFLPLRCPRLVCATPIAEALFTARLTRSPARSPHHPQSITNPPRVHLHAARNYWSE